MVVSLLYRFKIYEGWLLKTASVTYSWFWWTGSHLFQFLNNMLETIQDFCVILLKIYTNIFPLVNKGQKWGIVSDCCWLHWLMDKLCATLLHAFSKTSDLYYCGKNDLMFFSSETDHPCCQQTSGAHSKESFPSVPRSGQLLSYQPSLPESCSVARTLCPLSALGVCSCVRYRVDILRYLFYLGN